MASPQSKRLQQSWSSHSYWCSLFSLPQILRGVCLDMEYRWPLESVCSFVLCMGWGSLNNTAFVVFIFCIEDRLSFNIIFFIRNTAVLAIYSQWLFWYLQRALLRSLNELNYNWTRQMKYQGNGKICSEELRRIITPDISNDVYKNDRHDSLFCRSWITNNLIWIYQWKVDHYAATIRVAHN